jgi:hypothetical protein
LILKNYFITPNEVDYFHSQEPENAPQVHMAQNIMVMQTKFEKNFFGFD